MTGTGPPLRTMVTGAGILLAAAALLWLADAAAASEEQRLFRPTIAVSPEGMTCVLGGGLDGRLVDAKAITPLMTHKQEYALVSLDGARDIAWSIGRPREQREEEGGCDGVFQQELSLGPAQLGDYLVAVRGSLEEARGFVPETLRVDSDKAPEYRDLVARYLKDLGIDEPKVSIRQIVETDLDGDGVPDALVNAVNTRREESRKGEYSVVLLKLGAAPGAPPLEVASDVTIEDSDEPSALWENTIAGIVDIDGDHVMEIVLYGAYLYGDGWQVMRLGNGQVDAELECGCGG